MKNEIKVEYYKYDIFPELLRSISEGVRDFMSKLRSVEAADCELRSSLELMEVLRNFRSFEGFTTTKCSSRFLFDLNLNMFKKLNCGYKSGIRKR